MDKYINKYLIFFLTKLLKDPAIFSGTQTLFQLRIIANLIFFNVMS